jgi:hypothetical protein
MTEHDDEPSLVATLGLEMGILEEKPQDLEGAF